MDGSMKYDSSGHTLAIEGLGLRVEGGVSRCRVLQRSDKGKYKSNHKRFALC